MICSMCGTENRGNVSTCRSCGARLSESQAVDGASHGLPAGTKLQSGAYTIGKVLGQGGFGITYQGGEHALRRSVAIKEFFPQGCIRRSATVQPTGSLTAADYIASKDRFLQEARTLARFECPNIVRVHSCFEENSTAYMVMELLDGESLSSILERRGHLPEQEALTYIRATGEGLATVHAAGLLHRDIKPENVMVRKDGQAVLVDFGSAREFAPGKTRRMTAMLTPGYAPLEQYGQQARFGTSTDIYALGATLYHLLTGEPPVRAPDRASGVELRSPIQVERSVSRVVSDAVMWALEMKGSKRPQTVDDFLKALQGAMPAPTSTGSGRSQKTSGPADPAAQTNPYAPRIAQISAELSRPIPPPLKNPRDDEITAIEQQLAHIASSLPKDPTFCPACQKARMVRHTGEATGFCPLCGTTKLVERQLDMYLCPICRDGHLAPESISSEQSFCPVCRSAVMQSVRRRRFGVAMDLWWTCPHCHAEMNVVTGRKAKLVEFTDDPHGIAAQYGGLTLPISQWRDISGRTDVYLACNVCAAQFEPIDTDRLTLRVVASDPHGVGGQRLGRTLLTIAWAKIAHGLSLMEGNLYCPQCEAQFDHDNREGQTLKLLQIGTNPRHWDTGWVGQKLPIQTWYLAMHGKTSLHPGLLCPSCGTEFDSEQALYRLVRTQTTAIPDEKTWLAQPIGDWHRIFRGLVSQAEEAALKNSVERLHQLRQSEIDTWQRTQQEQRKKMDDELVELMRRAVLEGSVLLPADPRLRLRGGERLRLTLRAWKVKLRVREGRYYLDPNRESGEVCITDQRIVFAGDYGTTWQRSLDKLMAVQQQNQCLVLAFSDLQKPIYFSVVDTEVDVTVGGVTRKVVISMKDAITVLNQPNG